MPHNRANLCRYTHGSERCPEIPTQRVAGKLWCERHAIWRRANGSQDEGLALLRDIAREHESAIQDLSASGGVDLGQSGRHRSANAQLAAMREICSGKRSAGYVPFHAYEDDSVLLQALRQRVLEEYRAKRDCLREAGEERVAAHEAALVAVVFEGIVWRIEWWIRVVDGLVPGFSRCDADNMTEAADAER